MHQTLCDLEIGESGIMRGTSVGMVVCEIAISEGIDVCDIGIRNCVWNSLPERSVLLVYFQKS